MLECIFSVYSLRGWGNSRISISDRFKEQSSWKGLKNLSGSHICEASVPFFSRLNIPGGADEIEEVKTAIGCGITGGEGEA